MEDVMPAPEFDEYSHSYSEGIENTIGIFGKKHDFFVRNKAEILLPALATIENETSRLNVLDVGCGVGLMHRYIAGSVGSLEGTDISGASLEIARNANPGVHYKIYDGRTLPYSDARFDCAYAICVMHHVPVDQWLEFLKEMRRVVRPGGLIVIVEHNPLNPATQWVVRTSAMDANAVLLKPWTLRTLMKSAGIGHSWIQYVLFTPFAGKAFRILDRVLSRVPFGAQYAIAGRA
jgi:ubiquinone/menaquinone biosynthesis C-methylase UbiE